VCSAAAGKFNMSSIKKQTEAPKPPAEELPAQQPAAEAAKPATSAVSDTKKTPQPSRGNTPAKPGSGGENAAPQNAEPKTADDGPAKQQAKEQPQPQQQQQAEIEVIDGDEVIRVPQVLVQAGCRSASLLPGQEEDLQPQYFPQDPESEPFPPNSMDPKVTASVLVPLRVEVERRKRLFANQVKICAHTSIHSPVCNKSANAARAGSACTRFEITSDDVAR
jgi:hypothetical protein